MTLMLACAASGCRTIKHHYPVYPLPTQPVIRFDNAGDHCLSGAEFQTLTEYVLRLQSTARKYQREIEIINGE